MAYQSEIDKLKRRYDEKPEQWFAALADAHRKNGEIEQALAIVRSGIKERPNYVSGHIVLGRCLVDKGSDDEAEKVFEEVLELDAENIIALKVLGDVAERRGNVEGARRWLERLLEVDPMNEEARDALERVLTTAAQPPQPVTISPPSPDVEIVRQSAPHATDSTEAPQDDADSIPPEFDVDAATPVAQAPTPDAQESTHVAEAVPPQSVTPKPVEAAPPSPPEFMIERASDPFARADQPDEDLSELLDTGARVVSFDEPEPPAPQDADEEPEPIAGLVDSSAGLRDDEEDQHDRSTEVAGLEAQDLSWLADVAASSWPSEVEEPQTTEESTEEVVDVELVEGDTQPIPRSAVTDLRESGAPPPAAQPPSRSIVEPVAPEPAVEEPAPQAAEDPEGVVTETMAEVFAAQGLIDQARDVYLKLLRQRPTDESIRHKLVELEQRRKSQAPARASAPQADRVSSREVAASATGGTSVRSFFSDLLSKRPTAGAPVVVDAKPSPAVPDPRSVLPKREAARRSTEPSRAGGVPGHAPTNRGEPTRPAGDEVSLASVFGEQEATDEAREPIRREGKSAPKAGAGTGAAASDVGMTFDRFFGGSSEEPKVEEASGASEDDDEEFKAWLQGLKS